jgi:hypothetical protein
MTKRFILVQVAESHHHGLFDPENVMQQQTTTRKSKPKKQLGFFLLLLRAFCLFSFTTPSALLSALLSEQKQKPKKPHLRGKC